MRTRLHRFTAGALALAFTLLFAAPPQLFAQAAQPAAAATNAPQDRWPRKFTANGSQLDLYTPQLDSWDGRTIEWHAAVSVTAPGAKEPTFGVVFSQGQDRRGQDDAARRADESRDHERELPLGARRQRHVPRHDAQGAAGQEDRDCRARQAGGQPRDPPGAEEGRRRAAQERTAGDRLLERPGDPRPRGRRARLAAGPEHRPAAGDQHEPDHPEGQDRRALPPPLRRLDARRGARRTLGSRDDAPGLAREGARSRSSTRRPATRSPAARPTIPRPRTSSSPR